jgi:hypothetical protein
VDAVAFGQGSHVLCLTLLFFHFAPPPLTQTNRENYSSANSKRYIPTPKWTCDGPNSNGHFANMEERAELPFLCPKTPLLLLSKWSPNDKPIWLCNKWCLSIGSIGRGEPGMKPCKKNERRLKLAKWERKRKMSNGISHCYLLLEAASTTVKAPDQSAMTSRSEDGWPFYHENLRSSPNTLSTSTHSNEAQKCNGMFAA